jgi:phosphoserine phosphatase RsbU/P
MSQNFENLSDRRILIVDDVKANIDVLIGALREDYKLSVATDGEMALKSAEKNPPDLVLLDIMMPGLDGYEVCRRLRAAPRTREVPVMFLSALDEVTNKAKGFEVGGNDYLTKPFEMLEVKARVGSLIRAKAYSEAVKARMTNELRIAREIQLGFLGADLESATEGTGIDVHAVLEPAREVGGDLYAVQKCHDGSLVVAVGDVSGKGIPAALFMAVTTTLLRMAARQLKTPEQIILQVSDALAAQNPQNLFVTLFCAIFDPTTASLRCANAGHPSPVLLRAGSAPSLPFPPSAMVAGIFPGMEVSSQAFSLKPGDTVVFYTDGVTEAFNSDQILFGESRLTEHLARDGGERAADTVTGLVKAVKAYAGEFPQSDDITVLAMRLQDA